MPPDAPVRSTLRPARHEDGPPATLDIRHGLAGRSDDLLDLREERRKIEGLGHVVHRAAGEAMLDVLRAVLRRDEDDRDAAVVLVPLDRSTELEAVDPRHHHVED